MVMKAAGNGIKLPPPPPPPRRRGPWEDEPGPVPPGLYELLREDVISRLYTPTAPLLRR